MASTLGSGSDGPDDSLPGPTGTYTPAFLLSWMIILGIGLMMTPHIFLRYFAADPDDATVFHRTVGLRDEWANIQKRKDNEAKQAAQRQR